MIPTSVLETFTLSVSVSYTYGISKIIRFIGAQDKSSKRFPLYLDPHIFGGFIEVPPGIQPLWGPSSFLKSTLL